MKQWKKQMAIILAAVLVIVGFNVSPKFAAAADTPKFYADEITVQPGSQIEVPIKISGNTGIMGLGLEIGFDKQVLTPIDDVQKTNLLSGIFNDSVATMPDGANAFKVLWSGTDAMAEDGHLFTVKFRVAEGVSGSTKITLKLIEDDTYDEASNNVAADCRDIKVTIQSSDPDRTKEPTKEPTEEPTKEPTGEPKPGEYWDGQPVKVYAYCYGADNDVFAEVNGNGDYTIHFTANTETDNIDVLSLETYQSVLWLPPEFKIVPTKLQVGEAVYEIGKCAESNSYSYTVNIRYFSDIDNIVGKPVVPVKAGETVTVYFRVEGYGKDAAPQVTPTPDGTNPATPPDGNTGSNKTEQKNVNKSETTHITNPTSTGRSNKVKKPGKVTGVRSFSKKKKILVLWNWKTGVNGFQIQYAWNKKFTKKKKSKFVGKKTSKIITKLKKGKTYYIRVRAYRKSSGKKIYGKWSKVKKCKVK